MCSASRRLYFDNAATSFPKPPAVGHAMLRVLNELGAPGRGSYDEARQSAHIINTCRQRIARLVNLPEPKNVVFGYNTTDALNLAIKGVIQHARRRLGPNVPIHVVSTTMEHNSVLRPMHALQRDDTAIHWTQVPVDPTTTLVNPADIRAALTPSTLLVIVNHASNVTGAVQDIDSIGSLIASASPRPLFLVDGAQSLGHTPVDMQRSHIDLLAFPGHKGLLGPTGVGGLCIAPGVEPRLDTIREGGTGSVSEQQTHPAFMPEKFEPGSHNTVGIAGLSEGVAWILDRTIASLATHERSLSATLIEAFDSGLLPGFTLLGPRDPRTRVGVFSFTHDALDPAELVSVLESEHNILARAGLHCAPLAHQTLGTRGAARLSIGPFHTRADIDLAIAALAAIARDYARPADAPLTIVR